MIEQAVAASGDGLTLMDRLHSERYLRGIEVRLLPPDRAADLTASGPGDAPSAGGGSAISRRRFRRDPSGGHRAFAQQKMSGCWSMVSR